MSGRPFLTRDHPALARLARIQADVATRDQLDGLGVGYRDVYFQLRAQRWREIVPGVVVLHCGPLPVTTLRWAAVLAAGPGAALGSWTALWLHGLRGWERDAVHVVVRRGRHVPRLADVVVHESRRHADSDVITVGGYPGHGVERAAVDAATWSTPVRTACGLLAAVVQQRLSTPARLVETLETAGRIRHRSAMLVALRDIDGGSQALSEIDVVALCRRAGLPEPSRQRLRLDVNGRRRYLDAEWERPDGSVLALEIDGIGHLDPRRWYDDLLRQAEITFDQPHQVIRLPASAARREPQRVAAILARALGRRPA